MLIVTSLELTPGMIWRLGRVREIFPDDRDVCASALALVATAGFDPKQRAVPVRTDSSFYLATGAVGVEGAQRRSREALRVGLAA
jgi:hypothetical protein